MLSFSFTMGGKWKWICGWIDSPSELSYCFHRLFALSFSGVRKGFDSKIEKWAMDFSDKGGKWEKGGGGWSGWRPHHIQCKKRKWKLIMTYLRSSLSQRMRHFATIETRGNVSSVGESGQQLNVKVGSFFSTWNLNESRLYGVRNNPIPLSEKYRTLWLLGTRLDDGIDPKLTVKPIAKFSSWYWVRFMHTVSEQTSQLTDFFCLLCEFGIYELLLYFVFYNGIFSIFCWVNSDRFNLRGTKRDHWLYQGSLWTSAFPGKGMWSNAKRQSS